MNSTFKSILKYAAIGIVPGAFVFWMANRIVKGLNDRQEFRDYIRSTYGTGSKYENDHDEH